jgi:hypothetical protein
MRWNDHSRFAGTHALLSPSKYSWVNYDEDRLLGLVDSSVAARRGSELHALAQMLIRLGERLPEGRRTLNNYVNDCIGFRLTPEQMLFYSPICFGQADAVGFRKNLLRIFDLKTGVNECKFVQLEIYAALFCLEYKVKPTEIEIELRIYQNDEVRIEMADPLDITSIMDKIVFFDRRMSEINEEVFG